MSTSGKRAPPPQLHFDDGSRMMMEQQQLQTQITSDTILSSNNKARSNYSIHVYYEIERMTKEVQRIWFSNRTKKGNNKSQYGVRVALQFPDGLLEDAPDVCWAMEHALNQAIPEGGVLVFILGDTTFGPCCPDEVSALHLEADVLIHYGHACLSPAASLPVLYSFGISEMNVSECAEIVKTEVERTSTRRVLLLFEVRYNHAMEDLQTLLTDVDGDMLIISGQIPDPTFPTSDDDDQPMEVGSKESADESSGRNSLVVGGLKLPTIDVDLSEFTVLFIGDSSSESRQYVNLMLRLMTVPRKPTTFWSYSPQTKSLLTSLPPYLGRSLNRRFFLVQKARDCGVFGILVGTLSQRHFTSVVSSLRKAIQSKGRSCYTFAVGKVNPAKLANFAEIECFVLVACAENSILDNERDIHVPVVTPLELSVALGLKEWGEYSLDYNDFLEAQSSKHEEEGDSKDGKVGSDADEDAPYFSLVSGSFVNQKRGDSDEINLKALPGGGQLMAFQSEASNFLRQREYQGLETDVGKTEVHVAKDGKVGIASNYNNS